MKQWPCALKAAAFGRTLLHPFSGWITPFSRARRSCDVGRGSADAGRHSRLTICVSFGPDVAAAPLLN
jgi:hypothetical protein